MKHHFIFLLFIFSVASYFPAKADNHESFQSWAKAFKQEAAAKGIDKKLLDQAFSGLTLNPKVIKLDRKQPEGSLSFTQYLTRVVPKARVQMGKQLLNKHRPLLEKIGKQYGVQPRYIVALWGVETDFGRITGGFSIIRALATLAFDGRRSAFFRKELHNAFRIIHDGHISLQNMKGSWAGAMGQTQFMPSSFLNFAVDYNGDGKKDIWNTREDAFASIANYLSKSGWDDSITWGRKVQLPKGFDQNLIFAKSRLIQVGPKTLKDWQKLGVRRINGDALYADHRGKNIPSTLIYPGKAGEGTYLVYQNYATILEWNRSLYFATAVGTLSDRIAGRR